MRRDQRCSCYAFVRRISRWNVNSILVPLPIPSAPFPLNPLPPLPPPHIPPHSPTLFAPLSYVYSDNAFAARLTPQQAALLSNHPAVAHVAPDRRVQPATTYTPVFLNVSTVMWPAAGIGGASAAGKGMVVAVIDTGIWPEHPSFSDVSASE